MSWQEMQSAPHDGTTVIVRYPLQGNVKRIARYNTLHKFWESNGEPFWPVQQHCQWAAIPPDVAAPSAANGAATCPACQGNDADMPCAYPSERVKGCLRDLRLSANGVEMPQPDPEWPAGEQEAFRLGAASGPNAALVEALKEVVAEWDRMYPGMPNSVTYEDAEFGAFNKARAALAAVGVEP